MNTALALQDTMTIADAFVESGFFQDAKSQAQAIVKILAGSELGFGPMASMSGVYIVKGKVTLSANLMAAAVKNTGRYNYRVKNLTDTECSITFYERTGDKWEQIGVSTFTIGDAKAANLLGSSTWKNYPRNMLFARAISNGVKWYCPDIFGAPLYTPDELGAAIDGETGEIIDAESVVISDEPKEEEKRNVMPDAMRKRFHATGKSLYGEDWDTKRHELVTAVTGDEGASSKMLSPEQGKKLIDGMQRKLNERDAEEAPDAELLAAAKQNADSIHAE